MTDVHEKMRKCVLAVFDYALRDEDGLIFLQYWYKGDFQAIRKEWPDAPEEVFWADPCYKEKINMSVEPVGFCEDTALSFAIRQYGLYSEMYPDSLPTMLHMHTCHKCKHAYKEKWDAQNCCAPDIQTRYVCASCKKHYKTPTASTICCRREVNQKTSSKVSRSEIIHSMLCLLQTVRSVTDNEYTESFEEYESLAFDDIGGLIQKLIEENSA